MKKLERTQEHQLFIIILLLFITTYLAVTLELKSKVKDSVHSYKDIQVQLLKTKAELKKRNDLIIQLKKEPSNIVIATVYQNTKGQTNTDNYTTASNFKLDSLNNYKHRIIAVSRDLLNKYPFGSKVLVQGRYYAGIWIVRDVMNKRYNNRIDFLVNNGMQNILEPVTLKRIN